MWIDLRDDAKGGKKTVHTPATAEITAETSHLWCFRSNRMSRALNYISFFLFARFQYFRL